jgi:two-component system sensor histidine kinase YesM
MDKQRLQKLQACLHEYKAPGFMTNIGDKGIGLANIYRRIKLFYGSEAIMEIDSTLHVGTTVSITFSAHKQLLEAEVSYV